MKNLSLMVIVSIAVVFLLSACATSPTGRSQIILYSENQLADMGQQAFAGMKSDIKISRKPVENRFIQCIADELLVHVNSSVFNGEWEVVVFDDDQVNAFALPGGKIGVYTGLLAVAENQHQVAAVIGHEIGHVIARHGNERMSNSAVIGVTQQTVGQVLTANEVASTPAIMRALGLGVQYGTLAYSRTHESESDEIGLTLMAQAGFKPSESVELWKNMAAQSSSTRQPEFLSTHPSPETRIRNLSKQMPRAKALYENANNRPKCG